MIIIFTVWLLLTSPVSLILSRLFTSSLLLTYLNLLEFLSCSLSFLGLLRSFPDFPLLLHPMSIFANNYPSVLRLDIFLWKSFFDF